MFCNIIHTQLWKLNQIVKQQIFISVVSFLIQLDIVRMATYRNTRSVENPDVDYPLFDFGEWTGSGHLPTSSEVIGAIRFTVSNKVSSKDASEMVAKILVDHWTNRNDQSCQECPQET